MPKVKDLGVTVVPEKGVGRCTDDTNACSSCTNEMARLTIMPPPRAGGAGCSDCTMVPFSICGTTPGPRPCTDCTMLAFSICGTSPQFCTDCTHVAFSICGTSPIACRFATHNPWTPCGGTWQTPCGGSWGDPWGRPAGGGGLTQQSIDQLRQQLQAQLAQLDEVEKSLGPQTTEEIDAREKELNAELAKLKTARSKIKSKK